MLRRKAHCGLSSILTRLLFPTLQRLGHTQLVNKRSSVAYAESVAQMKLGDQPEKKENVLSEDVTRVDPMMTVSC